jgi:DNA repair photolyase
MNPEFPNFESKGLKIDKDRVLTYSQLICPVGCLYCFGSDLNLNRPRRDAAYLSEEQFQLLGELPPEVKMIMLGCDTEFFQPQSRALEILQQLARLSKDISVVTKTSLSEELIAGLVDTENQLKRHNNFLSFSESLTSLRSAKDWEPKAPNPAARIETLRKVFNTGIRTFVAIRPLLPTVSEEELKELVASTKDCCYGYYSGPLYLKSLEHPLIDLGTESDLSIEKIQPHWMPEGNEFYRIEKNGQMDALRNIVEENGQLLFEGAAEAMNYWRGK